MVAAPFTGGASLAAIPAINAVGGIASGIGGAISGGAQAAAATHAADLSAQVQREAMAQAQANQLPFMQGGQAAITPLQNLLGIGPQPGPYPQAIANLVGVGQQGVAGSPYLNQLQNMMGLGPGGAAGMNAALAQTPGYQFALSQGLQATQNAQAAQGLGVSGSALRGAADYATGLASTTYNNQLQNLLNAYTTNYNTLTGAYGQQAGALQNLANMGANTAVQAGSQQIGGAQQIGATQAAGTMAAAQGFGNAVQSLASIPLMTNALGGTTGSNQNALAQLFGLGGGGSTITDFGMPGGTNPLFTSSALGGSGTFG